MAPRPRATIAPALTLRRRPMPPKACADDEPVGFFVDQDFAAWIMDTFVRFGGSLHNDEHQHLQDAYLGVVWTNAINRRQQREVMGTAEIPSIQAGGWRRARFEHQMHQWFGQMPDFLLTFSGPMAGRLSDRLFCALVEHELMHCAQAVDFAGDPKFHEDTGLPVYAMRGHCVEQFVGVMERYGPMTADERAFVAAANRAPLIDDEPLELACGTCLRAA